MKRYNKILNFLKKKKNHVTARAWPAWEVQSHRCRLAFRAQWGSPPCGPAFCLLPAVLMQRKSIAVTSFHRWHSCLCARSSKTFQTKNRFVKVLALREGYLFLKNIAQISLKITLR